MGIDSRSRNRESGDNDDERRQPELYREYSEELSSRQDRVSAIKSLELMLESNEWALQMHT